MLLHRIEVDQTIKFDDWRWKVSYGMPAHGKDFWGRKAEERARLEKETGKTKRKSGRFSWKRSRKEKKLQEEELSQTPTRPEAEMARTIRQSEMLSWMQSGAGEGRPGRRASSRDVVSGKVLLSDR